MSDFTSYMELTKNPVRIGVIGLGNMGRHHVRVLSEMPNVVVVAAADPDEEARAMVEHARKIRTYADYRQMLENEELEAVTVVVPTSRHFEVTMAAIEHGIHFLVEKPLAATVEEALTIRAAVDGTDLIGTVGHIERYNPAVMALKRGLAAGELGMVFQMRATRTGPLPNRIRDVGVVVDLASHDLDIVRHLVGHPVQRIFAETASRMNSAHEDLFSGIIRFTDGTIALLDVNWLAPLKIRELVVVGEGGMYRLDYQSQDLFFYENSFTAEWSNAGRRGVSEGNMVRYRIDRREPLRVELESFITVIRGGSAHLVSLDDGVAAVELADAVRLSAASNVTIRPAAGEPVRAN
jgi:predicted dehydrogenase